MRLLQQVIALRRGGQWKSHGSMHYGISSNILWIDKVPAFVFLPNGEKDPITPTGWTWYMVNQKEIDTWISSSKFRHRHLNQND